MEQKVVDRYDMTLKLLNERIAEFNRDKETFFSEFFTDEIKSIIKSIIVSTNRSMEFVLSDEWILVINSSFYPEFFKPTNPNNRHTFYVGELNKDKELNRGRVVQLENYVKQFRLIKNIFEMFVDQAEKILCDIVTEYRSINEECMDKLNGVMSMLDGDVEDIKHIKITVEWV